MQIQRLYRAAILAAALASCIALLGGCGGNSGLVNMWRDPTWNDAPMDRILVVGMVQNAARRRILEDAFGHELEKRAVEVVPSYEEFPASPPDTTQINDAVSRGRYDGVLIATRLRPEVSSTYVPGYVTTRPVSTISPWSGRYRTYWVDVMQPGYVEENIAVRHEVELWAMREGGRLVWTAVGETVNPSSASEVNRDIAKNVVPELEKQGYIPRKRK